MHVNGEKEKRNASKKVRRPSFLDFLVNKGQFSSATVHRLDGPPKPVNVGDLIILVITNFLANVGFGSSLGMAAVVVTIFPIMVDLVLILRNKYFVEVLLYQLVTRMKKITPRLTQVRNNLLLDIVSKLERIAPYRSSFYICCFCFPVGSHPSCFR